MLIVTFEKLLYTSLSKHCTDLCRIKSLASSATRQRCSDIQFLFLWKTAKFSLLQSRNYLNNMASGILIPDINNLNCSHQQYELSISTNHVDIHNSNCRYQQYKLYISTIRIADIDNLNCRCSYTNCR